MNHLDLSSSSGVPNMGGNDRPAESSGQDALAGLFKTPIDPAFLNNPVGHGSSAQNIQQGPLFPVPAFERALAYNIPEKDHAPQTAQNPHRYHPYPPPKSTYPKAPQPPKLRAHFLREFPSHDYALPVGGPINATLPEIIVIFPNWFRNWDICYRFQNNGITGSIHLAILEKYRDLNLTTALEYERARDRLADQYRKTMRQGDPNWSKVTQKAPEGWNQDLMAINSFLPDVARQPNYKPPAPIMFKSLAEGLKSLPQGSDAGDLTRALDYAMHNHMVDKHGNAVNFMFPDDLQKILDYIGRTVVTKDHTDTFAVARAGANVRKRLARQATVAPSYQQQPQVHEQLQPMFSQAPQHNLANRVNFPLLADRYFDMPSTGMGAPVPTPGQQMPQDVPQKTQMYASDMASYSADQLYRSLPPEAAATVASRGNTESTSNPNAPQHPPGPSDFPEIPDVCRIPELEQENLTSQVQEQPRQDEKSFTMEDMDDVVLHHQSRVSIPLFYPPTQLLRDCVEGSNDADHSDFARAARWARGHDLDGFNFQVADVEFIIQMLDTNGGLRPAAGTEE